MCGFGKLYSYGPNQSINHFLNAMYVQIKAIQQRLWWWWILFNTNHKFNSIRFQYYSYTLTYNKFFFWTSEIVSKINVKKMKIVRNTLYNFVSFCLFFLFVCSLFAHYGMIILPFVVCYKNVKNKTPMTKMYFNFLFRKLIISQFFREKEFF